MIQSGELIFNIYLCDSSHLFNLQNILFSNEEQSFSYTTNTALLKKKTHFADMKIVLHQIGTPTFVISAQKSFSFHVAVKARRELTHFANVASDLPPNQPVSPMEIGKNSIR